MEDAKREGDGRCLDLEELIGLDEFVILGLVRSTMAKLSRDRSLETWGKSGKTSKRGRRELI